MKPTPRIPSSRSDTPASRDSVLSQISPPLGDSGSRLFQAEIEAGTDRQRLIESISRGDVPFPGSFTPEAVQSLLADVQARRLTELLGWMARQIAAALDSDSADQPQETDRC